MDEENVPIARTIHDGPNHIRIDLAAFSFFQHPDAASCCLACCHLASCCLAFYHLAFCHLAFYYLAFYYLALCCLAFCCFGVCCLAFCYLALCCFPLCSFAFCCFAYSSHTQPRNSGQRFLSYWCCRWISSCFLHLNVVLKYSYF